MTDAPTAPAPPTFAVGAFRCHLLDAGRQWLDGGAMFGVVPWTLWSSRVAVDDRRRIPLGMRCLLVEHPDGLVLVDTGLGDKETAKFHDIYGVDNAGEPGPTRLEDSLRAAGFDPEDVRWVVNTHLHFDHAGGNTVRERDPDAEADHESADPAVRLAFPNATYVVQAGELMFAERRNERTRASYLPNNFVPVAEAGRWRLLDGDEEILPGLAALCTPGHVPWHQSILLRSGGEVACFLGDLVPTAAHLPLPWIMGYDLEPLRTLETKRTVLRRAVDEGWRLVFEHDPLVAMGRVVKEGRDLVLVDTVEQPL